jgi:cytochrome c oxidase subunit 2
MIGLRISNLLSALTALLGGLFVGTRTANAAQPVDWGVWFQPAASGRMRDIVWFGEYTFWIIAVIALFVTGLLGWIVVRYNKRAHAVATRTSHNTTIEILWTVVPVLILIFIAIPSFRLLFNQLEIPAAEVTVKATGYQWYWGYQYPDTDGVEFDSVMLTDEEREAKKNSLNLVEQDVPRLLAVDNEMVVPVDKIVVLQVTAEDVLHAFAMPALGLKIDAVPGRLNQTWFKADREGVYFGQCSELCGRNHAFMPIAIRVVSQQRYDAWTTAAESDLDAANKLVAAWIVEDNRKFAQLDQ